MMKKLLCLICALAMMATAIGCGKTATTSEPSSEEVDIGGFMSFENGTADNNGTESISGGQVSSNSQGGVQVKIEKPKEPTQQKSTLASKDYGGKKFKFLYWYQPSAVVNEKVAAFNKAHKANVKVEVVHDDPNVTVAKSIASGQPYDIIASHGNYFPQTIFQNIYSPLESYIAKEDMFNAANPEGGGLSAAVNDSFAWGGHYYALGSANSIYQNVIYYNKKIFNESGLDDPWELYKKGQWTWDKLVTMGRQVTDVANKKSFISMDGLNVWLTLNAVSAVSFQNGTYVENLTGSQMVKAVQDFKNLYKGENPISLKPEGSPFTSGKLYMMVSQTDGYDKYAKDAKVSSAFGRKVENLGCVPVPYAPNNTAKKYPGHAAQGYSSTKGTKDPSVAACYALFESRYTTKTTQGNMAEIRKEVSNLFAKNGYIGMSGFEDSSGKSINDIINVEIGSKVMDGGDVSALLNSQRQTLQRIIADSIKAK